MPYGRNYQRRRTYSRYNGNANRHQTPQWGTPRGIFKDGPCYDLAREQQPSSNYLATLLAGALARVDQLKTSLSTAQSREAQVASFIQSNKNQDLLASASMKCDPTKQTTSNPADSKDGTSTEINLQSGTMPTMQKSQQELTQELSPELDEPINDPVRLASLAAQPAVRSSPRG